jgi:PAS domain S-box-containing protein
LGSDLRRGAGIAKATHVQRLDLSEQVRLGRLAGELAKVGYWRLDPATSDIRWSEEMFRMFGVAPGPEPALADAMAMVHPEDQAAADDSLAKALTTGEGYSSFTRVIWPSGEVRTLEGRTICELGERGRVVAVFGVLIDITEQRRAQVALAESEARYRLLADHAADFVVRMNADEVISYVSPSCRRYGYEPDDLIGMKGSDIVHPDDLANLRSIATELLSGVPVDPQADRDRRVRTKDGSWVWMEGNASVVRDDRGAGVELITQLRDVTRRRAVEAELRSARIQAETAASAKSDFLANMSHELRTPLTSILGFARLAAEQADLQGLTRSYVERVGDASAALLCTVNDILDFSKLEVGQVSIQREPTSLAKLCRATLDLFAPQAGAKDLSLTLDCESDLVLFVDPDRVRQLLLNLVGNAVKFTAIGGITLRIRYDAASGQLRVDVLDSGPGIAPERRDRLFKRFSQVDGSLTRSHGGTGLGLAICKGLVEAMGGEIGVESRVGEGSRFWFAIPAPVADLSPAAVAGASVERPSFTGVRVLVVDDHAANRELARLILTGIGAEISEAADGEEAAQLASAWPFDVILMDLRMPRLDGAGALRRIRETPGPNDATPILAFTADAGPEVTARLAGLGFEDVVAKPLEPGTLIAAVARATAFEQEPCWDEADVA